MLYPLSHQGSHLLYSLKNFEDSKHIQNMINKKCTDMVGNDNIGEKVYSCMYVIYIYTHTYAYILCTHIYIYKLTFVPTLKAINESGEYGVQHLNIAALMLLPCSHILFSWCLDTQSCLTLCSPMNYIPPAFSVHGISPVKNPGVGCISSLRGSS